MATRRQFLTGATVAALGAVFTGPIRPAVAGASPKASRQAPGYFRLPVGEVEVTALYDGGVELMPEILHGASPQELDNLLADACLDPAKGWPVAINAFLLNSGTNLILVDTGVGTYFGDKAGRLATNIRESGYRPEQIDTILLTHLHSDHALGLVDGAGKPLFPTAKVRVHADEIAYWLSPGAEGRVTEGQRKVLPALRAAVAPYQAAGTFGTFVWGEAPAPGVEAVPLAGHTPGQSGYRVSSKGESILFWGDIVHCLPAQFPHPEISIDFDVDQTTAIATRKRLMASLAKGREWVAGAHLPFPGIGHIRPVGSGFVWWPAQYTV